jgi:hypothetical protein
VIKVSEEAARLRQDMWIELNDLKALIRATAQARGEKQQKQLKEKTTIKSASWVAKDIVHSHLMVSNMYLSSIVNVDGSSTNFE